MYVAYFDDTRLIGIRIFLLPLNLHLKKESAPHPHFLDRCVQTADCLSRKWMQYRNGQLVHLRLPQTQAIPLGVWKVRLLPSHDRKSWDVRTLSLLRSFRESRICHSRIFLFQSGLSRKPCRMLLVSPTDVCMTTSRLTGSKALSGLYAYVLRI